MRRRSSRGGVPDKRQVFAAPRRRPLSSLCLNHPIIRFNVTPQQILFSGPDGLMVLPVDLTNLPQNTVFQPGETWNFQCWFRDVVGANFTSNTSDGLAITWQ